MTFRIGGIAILCFVIQARMARGADGDSGVSASTTPFRLAVVPQTGHSSFIKSIDVSSDGRYVLTGSADGTTKLWDVASGILLRTFEGTGHVAFVPDGRRMVTCFDASLVVWDLATGTRIRTISIPRNRAVQIDMLLDGHRVLVSYLAAESPIVALFDIDLGKKLREWRDRCSPRDNNFFSSVLSKDNQYVLTSCRRGRLSLWELDTGKTKWSSDLHDGTKYEMHFPAFLPNGERAVTGYSHVYDWNDAGKTLRLWDLKTGKVLRHYRFEVGISSIATFSDNRRVALLMEGGPIIIFDLETGRTLSRIQNETRAAERSSLALSPDEQSLVAPTAGSINARQWEVDTGDVLQSFRGDKRGIVSHIAVSRKDGLLAAATGSGEVTIWNALTGAMAYSLPAGGQYQSLDFSPDGKFLAAGSSADFKLWNVKIGPKAQQTRLPRGESFIYSPDGSRAATVDYRSSKFFTVWNASTWQEELTIPSGISDRPLGFSRDGHLLMSRSGVWDLRSGEKIHSFNLGLSGVGAGAFLPTGDQVLLATKPFVGLWDLGTGRFARIYTNASMYLGATMMAISEDGSRIASNGKKDNDDFVYVWDTQSGALLHQYKSPYDEFVDIRFLRDNAHVVTASRDGLVRVWNLDTGDYMTMTVAKGEWLVYTEDGYFDASRRGGKALALVDGMSGYRVDQLAVRYNRPDIILARLGLGSKALIHHYNALYKRRLKKLGLEADQLGEAFDRAPTVMINQLQKDGKFVDLGFEMIETTSSLARFNVYVNDVPIFGSLGKPVSGRREQIDLRIELTAGKNKIEVSAMNALGVESLRESCVVTHSGDETGDLYYVGFGVSSYRNKALDLKYAAKDVEDLAAVLSGTGKRSYRSVKTLVTVDEAVTVAAIQEARGFLADATVDDTVVLFVAGHGLYDTKTGAEYYYLTHDSNPDDLAGTAASFELIENLLQGIRPRKKLFLMDTCQSGEMDGAEETAVLAQATSRGLRARGIMKKTLAGQGVAPKRYVSDQRRYIYNDLFRRSGAIVLSSSRGSEWSYERDDIQNGIFTEQVIAALTTTVADVDKDDFVSTEELRNHVTKAVARDTNGLQHPVVDRDNLEILFSFPLAR